MAPAHLLRGVSFVHSEEDGVIVEAQILLHLAENTDVYLWEETSAIHYGQTM